jgi:NAD(P)-dependent dehydrogenase (short-subunit alcohol dehydrogenase family)
LVGANQGIGYETAKNLLLSSGNQATEYHVIIGSRDHAKGVEAAAKLREEYGKRMCTVEAVQLDVTDDSSVDAAAAYVQEKHGRVDVLINNAGIGSQIRRGSVADGGVREALRRVLDTNVIGAVSVTEAFMPLLLAPSPNPGQHKRLIFISSTTGSLTYASDPNHVLHGSGGAIDYRTSKAALSMIVIQYDAALRGRGVKVFGVNPGCM